MIINIINIIQIQFKLNLRRFWHAIISLPTMMEENILLQSLISNKFLLCGSSLVIIKRGTHLPLK